MSTGDIAAGLGGIGLFIFLFMDWFGDVSAWKGFDVVDVILALIAVAAVIFAVARATGGAAPIPAIAIALGGFAAVVITLTFVLEGDDKKIGLWLSLIAAIAIAWGGWTAGRTAAAPARPAAPTV
jgi:hypothetical protein